MRTTAKTGSAVRRGSTLVLVLGTLALISILTIVYVSIGRADRRTATAAGEQTERSVSVGNLLDWPGQVIGSDRTATHIESVDPISGNSRFAREAVDLPATSPGFMSVVPTSTMDVTDRLLEVERFRFRPEGTVNQAWLAPTGQLGNYLGDLEGASGGSRLADLDFRSISDPFLASTLPADIDADAVTNNDAAAGYIYMRDWAHISNFAPDGRAVNIYNIREDADYGRASSTDIDGGQLWRGALRNKAGGFDAPSGFSVGNRFSLEATGQLADLPGNVPDPLAISDGLTLWEPRDNVNDPWIPTTVYRSPGDPGGTGIDLTVNGLDLINLPATWDSNQRELFRPAVDMPGDPGWDDPTYWRYQYADADGDGFLDSRWQELVDASDPRGARDLSGASGVRMFFAARAIDLSSLVNVNTAADSFASPTEAGGDRLGASPAEIELRRILSLEDVWADYHSDDIAKFGYDMFARPNDDFMGGARLDAGDYGRYEPFRAGNNGPGPLGQYFGARGAVAAIRRTLEDAVPPASGINANRNYTGLQDDLSDPTVGLFSEVVSPYTTYDGSPPLGLSDRAGDYARLGGTYGSNQASSLFGTDDLGELLAFWGANDERVTTRLELAVGGRGNAPGANGEPFHLSPLRSDRPRLLELTRGDWDDDGRYETGNAGEAERDLLFSIFNSRRYLTTRSGASPISGDGALQIGREISRSQAALGSGETRRLLHAGDDRLINPSGMVDAEQLTTNAFGFYLDVLAPYADEPDSYTDTTKATEAYGHAGPALPVRMAAHLAANFRDMADTDATSSVVYLDLDSSQTLPASYVDLSAQVPGTPMAGSIPDLLVYGIEAQPFITEVATFNVFTDAPRDAGGDQDWENGTLKGVRTLDTLVSPTNPDFLFQVFVIQLTNPYDKVIELTKPSPTDYWVEFANTAFRFPDGAQLQQNESRTFVAINPGTPALITSRINRVGVFGAGATLITEQAVESFLSELTGVTGPLDQSLLRIEQGVSPTTKLDLRTAMNPTLGSGVASTIEIDGTFDIDLLDGDAGVTDPAMAANKRVLLWRGAGDTDINDDLLVDRLHDSSRRTDLPTLDSRPFMENQEYTNEIGDFVPVAGDVGNLATTYAIADSYFDAVGNNDAGVESPWAIFHGSIRRPDTPAGVGNPSASYVPAWALERKPDMMANNRDSFNEAYLNGQADGEYPADSGVGLLDDDTFFSANANRAWAGLGIDSLVQKVNGGDGTVIDSLRSGVGPIAGDGRFQSRQLVQDIDGLRSQVSSPTAPMNFTNDLLIELPEPGYDDPAGPALRVGDTLLAMGIGPMRRLDIPTQTGNQRWESIEQQWVTLPEAVALALGYAEDVSPGVGTSPIQPDDYDQIAPVLDNGRVRLDDYVLYYDGDTSNMYEPAASGPDTTTGRYHDQLRGPGIPAALRVFTIATAGGELGTDQYGNLTRPMTGTVNLNTAPLAVLRTLPTLTPSIDLAGAGLMPSTPTWWASRVSGASNWPDANINVNGEPLMNVDIASTIAAYRDRASLFGRPQEISTVALDGAPPNNNGRFMDFTDPTPADGDPLLSSSATMTGRGVNGSGFGSGIAAMREGPGLLSLGELFGARYDGITVSDPLEAARVLRSIDSLGRDGANLGTPDGSVEAAYYGGMSDGIADDYEEQLVSLNAISNSASVRSDFFAVWMIVQGFMPEDVQGLRPTDPLVPSFRDRYLMIYDRSNVTRPGDEPRLLYRRKIRD